MYINRFTETKESNDVSFIAVHCIATDLCLSWPKFLNLVTVRGLMKTLV